jgi:hypothetical protein
MVQIIIIAPGSWPIGRYTKTLRDIGEFIEWSLGLVYKGHGTLRGT